MNWISVRDKLPEKDKLFWAFITGREEPIMVKYPMKNHIPDYCIILLQMMGEDLERGQYEARTMDFAEAIYLNKNNCENYFVTERSNCRAHGHFTHWLPFDDFILPEPPQEQDHELDISKR